jgi:hypothetical protein
MKQSKCETVEGMKNKRDIASQGPRSMLADRGTTSSSTSSSNEPVQDSVKIGLFLGADTITAYFAMSDRFQIHRLDDLINRQLVWKIGLVPEDQEGDAMQRGLFHQVVKFFCRYWECSAVCCIHDIPSLWLVCQPEGGEDTGKEEMRK